MLILFANQTNVPVVIEKESQLSVKIWYRK